MEQVDAILGHERDLTNLFTMEESEGRVNHGADALGMTRFVLKKGY